MKLERVALDSLHMNAHQTIFQMFLVLNVYTRGNRGQVEKEKICMSFKIGHTTSWCDELVIDMTYVTIPMILKVICRGRMGELGKQSYLDAIPDLKELVSTHK